MKLYLYNGTGLSTFSQPSAQDGIAHGTVRTTLAEPVPRYTCGARMGEKISGRNGPAPFPPPTSTASPDREPILLAGADDVSVPLVLLPPVALPLPTAAAVAVAPAPGDASDRMVSPSALVRFRSARRRRFSSLIISNNISRASSLSALMRGGLPAKGDTHSGKQVG